MRSNKKLVTDKDILKAYEVLKPVVRHTPLQRDRYLSQKYECTVYLKREDLQHVRSFKLRGAYYAIQQIEKSKLAKGVVCASAGNHAQGVAYTCQHLKVKAIIFMPSTTPQQKVNQVRFFGGKKTEIRLIGDTFDESAQFARDFAKKNEMSFIDPFNDKAIIAGQGTLAVEMQMDLALKNKEVDYVFAAVGGGGLLSGVASYLVKASKKPILVGVEPEGAPSMKASLDAGKVVVLDEINGFVDGAAVKQVGELTFQHIKAYVDQMILVPEGQVCSTIIDMYTKQAIISEPAGALSVAALEVMKKDIKGKTVVCIVSGGNNDINRMPEIEECSLLYEGLKRYFIVNFPQRPGALKEFVSDILGPNDDITKFEYTKKINRGSGPVIIGVLLKDKKSYAQLVQRMKSFDPHFIDLSENKTLYTLLV